MTRRTAPKRKTQTIYFDVARFGPLYNVPMLHTLFPNSLPLRVALGAFSGQGKHERRSRVPIRHVPLPPTPIAMNVFHLFGGARGLYRALRASGSSRNASSVYRWSYPKPRGRGGSIPLSARNEVAKAARHCKIPLTMDDMGGEHQERGRGYKGWNSKLIAKEERRKAKLQRKKDA